MFMKLTVVTNKREQETYIVRSKVLGFGCSPELGLTYLLSDSGHALVVKESLEDVKNLLNKPAAIEQIEHIVKESLEDVKNLLNKVDKEIQIKYDNSET